MEEIISEFYSNTLNNELIVFISCKKLDLIISFSPMLIEWKIIKKILDNCIQDLTDIQCCICEDFNIITGYKIGCSTCGNEICDHCFLQEWIKNDGIIKCPFCRYSVDKKLLLRNIVRTKCFSQNIRCNNKEFMYWNSYTRKSTSCYTLSYMEK